MKSNLHLITATYFTSDSDFHTCIGMNMPALHKRHFCKTPLFLHLLEIVVLFFFLFQFHITQVNAPKYFIGESNWGAEWHALSFAEKKALVFSEWCLNAFIFSSGSVFLPRPTIIKSSEVGTLICPWVCECDCLYVCLRRSRNISTCFPACCLVHAGLVCYGEKLKTK